jgi:hypothetical protein
MMVLDIDADGLPEHVKAFGISGSTRWDLKHSLRRRRHICDRSC